MQCRSSLGFDENDDDDGDEDNDYDDNEDDDANDDHNGDDDDDDDEPSWQSWLESQSPSPWPHLFSVVQHAHA